ncbi:MAG: sugar nucleotide-binding protein [Gammaproteobacteria bacterium]|nr:sugar nucleotide-binding protein [Gammaproteobacteria bacterium]MCY4358683.1 sugar nucleotide-binding protein [Gammaproteobacteria bacterium]
MRLFLVGARSPTGKDLTEILRKRKIRFLAPPEKNFEPENRTAIAKLVKDYGPTQLINLTDFISGNHSALRRAERSANDCHRINTELPAVLVDISKSLDIPMLHLSNAYVFDGSKRRGYNEHDETNPHGVYGQSSLAGEQSVRQHYRHVILRSGWLFGTWKKGLIKTWIRNARRNNGRVLVNTRRFSPTYTKDMAATLLAVAQQVDCEANVWGTYHYCGLESREEADFAELTLRFAANHDERIYQLLDRLKFIQQGIRSPEIRNSTLSSKKIFDTFGIKQKSWRTHLQEVVKTLYVDRGLSRRKKLKGQTSVA